MLDDLTGEERLRLMRFVCSFAWADLRIADSERDLVRKLVTNFDLDEDEQTQVEGWLTHPPRPEEIDPWDVPEQHRALFLEVARKMIKADGVVDDFEAETLALFEELLA